MLGVIFLKIIIEVTKNDYNDLIIEYFTKYHFFHDGALNFNALYSRQNYLSMFYIMFILLTNDNIFPVLKRMDFVDEHGIIEDILCLASNIKYKSKTVHYHQQDLVMFLFQTELKVGTIWIVDAYGTFEQNEEASYDIYVEEENCLYKHIRQSDVFKVMKHNLFH